jgi:hypothetical protein
VRWVLPVVASVALTLVAGVLPAAGTAARPLITAVYLNSEPDTAVALDRVVAAGATAVRVNMWWSLVASGAAPADPADPGDPAYNWSDYDTVISGASARGLQVYVTIVGAPPWAQTPPVATLFGNSHLPDPAAFGSFARAAATRYSGVYAALPRVRFWEAWNEPNISLYLIPQLDSGQPVSPGLYRQLLNAFAAAVHGIHADNVVITGGLAPFRDNTVVAQDPDWGPLSFMRDLLCLSPSLRPTCSDPVNFDVWSTHPYASGGPDHHASLANDVSVADLPKMRATLVAAEEAGHVVSSGPVEFWVTEFSWDSNPPDPLGVPEPLLSRWVAQALYRMWQNGVSLVTWLTLRDSSMDSIYQAGLYYRGDTFVGDTPKPSLEAFRFPVVAFQRRHLVTVWGRTPFGMPGSIVIEQATAGGGWSALGTLQADGAGIFQATYATSAGSDVRARVVSSGETSVPFSLLNVPDRTFTPFGGAALEPPSPTGRPTLPAPVAGPGNRVIIQEDLP